MDAAEKKAALDLVEEIQADRASARLTGDQVPHILLGYQARWHEDDAKIRMARKSRRVGFSWGCMAAESVVEASLQQGGMDQFYMGYNLRMAAEFIGDCAFWARAIGLAVTAIGVSKEIALIENEKRDIVTYKIEFASGHRIEALSSNPHNWRGKQGHARIDEAAFHPNLPELIKGALAFLMWGGRLDIVSTHNGEDEPFNELVKQVLAAKLDWSLHTVTFDDALRDGFYKRVCLVTGKEWSPEAEAAYREETFSGYPSLEDANEELLCMPKRGAGAYFSRVLIESCQEEGIPTLRFSQTAEFFMQSDREEVTKKWIADNLKPVVDGMANLRTVFGQDFGRNGDLSVLWPLQQVTALRWRTPFLLEMRRIPFDMQKLVVFWLFDNLPLLARTKFDARGNGQSHAEAAEQKAGSHKVEAVMASPAWYDKTFPVYHQAYEDGSIIVPAGEDVIADHRCVMLNNKGQPRMSDQRIKGSDGEFRHGDSAPAGLLAWTAAMEDGEPAYGASVGHDPEVYDVRARMRTSSRVWGTT